MPEDLISGDLNVHSIYIHSGITSTVTTSFSGPDLIGFGPQGLTFDGGKPTRRYGNLVSADESMETIYIHDGVTSTITTSFSMPEAGTESGPVTITVDASGNLISARAQESRPGSVRIHAGITSTVTTSFSTPFSNCRGITVDASGNLISDDVGTQSVYIHAGITSTITTSFSAAYHNGLEISEAGNLIAAKYWDPEDYIVIHAGITSTVTTSFMSPATHPWGITLNNPPSQDSVDLLGRFEVSQDSAELLGRFQICQDSAELLGRFEVSQDSAELLGRFEAQATAELLGKAEVGQDSQDLLGNVEVQQSGSSDLLYKFWVRKPYRLWTNRRYLNGVVDLSETLIGNAILEYVIEGVMQDIQSYLINAGLDYSGWTDIVLTPKLIRRATTYGTVAALYARRAKTFAGRVIPTMAPVTLTVIGDEERAMNHWRDKMNRALEFYVTSQGGDVMITSTSDEEPVFSTEDIPPELSDFTPWYQWLMRRTQ